MLLSCLLSLQSFSPAQFPVNRFGGNSESCYNYLTDATNHANDWFFITLGEGSHAFAANLKR